MTSGVVEKYSFKTDIIRYYLWVNPAAEIYIGYN